MSDFQGDDRPVDMVSWDDAQQLTVALAKRGFPGFRLPTEAERAWAARCGAPTRWAGVDRVEVVAVTGASQTVAVAGLSGSTVGAFDFSGNVWEWVGDWYERVPLAGVDVQGPASGSYCVFRGGGWGDSSRIARVAARRYGDPGIRYEYLGLRLLRAAP